jgi:hypothetical protein
LEQNVAEIKSFENIIDELKQIYPSAVVRGESILHSAGWITQIPQRINIAVLESRTYVDISGFVLSPKNKDWYQKVDGYLLTLENNDDIATYGLPGLPPALAVADLYNKNIIADWQPDPDDLDIEDWLEVKNAFAFFNIDIPEKYRKSMRLD